jgi:hypothetical protein
MNEYRQYQKEREDKKWRNDKIRRDSEHAALTHLTLRGEILCGGTELIVHRFPAKDIKKPLRG